MSSRSTSSRLITLTAASALAVGLLTASSTAASAHVSAGTTKPTVTTTTPSVRAQPPSAVVSPDWSRRTWYALALGTTPTSVPAGAARLQVGSANGGDGGTVSIGVPKSGRYVLQYTSTRSPNGFGDVVVPILDGFEFGQQVSMNDGESGLTETFYLSAGRHTFQIAGPWISGPLTETLIGTL